MSIQVSVVMCCYNSEKYLSLTLESLLNQTFQQYEVILINDGSTDNTLRIINEFATKFQKIKVVDQPNYGLNESRNIGLRLADEDAKYIVFFDSDDLFSNDLLSSLYEEISNDEDTVAVFSRFKKFDESNNLVSTNFGGFYEIRICFPQNKSRFEYYYFDFFTGNVPTIEPTFIFKKKELNSINGWDSINFPKGDTYGELVPLILDLKKLGKIKLSKNGCYYYRQHQFQITKNIVFDQRRITKIVNEKYFADFSFFTVKSLKLFLNSFNRMIRIQGSFKHKIRRQIYIIPAILGMYFVNLTIVCFLILIRGKLIKNKIFR